MIGRGAAAALLAAVLVSCAGGPTAGPPNGPALPRASEDRWLGGVCPATVVIQTEWEPEAETGGLYRLLGPGAVIDAERKRVGGPLVSAGRDTGVRVEVRAGGAAIGFVAIPAQMYLDRAITLGNVHTDIAVATSADQPVTAVFAPMAKSPEVLMWDPASHPDWRGVADIGRSGETVLVSKDTYIDEFLVGKGLIQQRQVDEGYTGAPARFVAEPTVAQYAYATSEPYIYEHEVPAWGKPLTFQLLADVGLATYSQAMSVRTGELESLAPCLRRLVPVLQRAHRDYLADPEPTDRFILDVVREYATSWTYSMERARHSVAEMKRLGIMANDGTGPFGGQDPARVQSMIDTFGPILTRAGGNVRPGLRAADIATNRFIDPAIRLE